MESLLSKVKGLFMINDYYDENDDFEEEVYTEQEQETNERPAISISERTVQDDRDSGVLVKKPLREDCKHVDFTPYSFEDLALVVDVLRAGKAVILHLEDLDDSFCQRVLDFASGVVYSLKCISEMPDDDKTDILIIIPNDAEEFGI